VKPDVLDLNGPREQAQYKQKKPCNDEEILKSGVSNHGRTAL